MAENETLDQGAVIEFPTRPRAAPKARPRARRVVAVGGGKGGIGKSLVSANLGIALAARGSKVVLVDADLGGANLHTCDWVPAKDAIVELADGTTVKAEVNFSFTTSNGVYGPGLVLTLTLTLPGEVDGPARVQLVSAGQNVEVVIAD